MTDRAPQGWVLELGRTVRGRCRDDHPLRPLLGAYGARFAVIPSAWCRTLVHGYYPPWYPPGIPTRYTHPACTQPPSARHAHRPAMPVSPRACTNDRFWDTVGEPRGVEYTAVSGSRAGLYRFIRFARPFDWVLDCSRLCSTEFSLCFTEFSLCFTEFSLELTSELTRID